MKKISFFAKIKKSIVAHKIVTSIVVIVLVVIGYEVYRAKASAASSAPQYVLSPARIGALMQTVTGSGQVSSSNQTDILGQVSGTILSINASVGQAVKKGDLIATIDSTNALASLRSAQLSLAKLQAPAKASDLTNAQNSVSKAYNDVYNAASSAYLDLPTSMAGMKDILYGQNGFLSYQNVPYLTDTAKQYRDAAGKAYDQAAAQYIVSLEEFKNTGRSSSPADLAKLNADTLQTMKSVADAATKLQSAITYTMATMPDYNSRDAATAESNVNGWASQANSDTSSVLAAGNSVTSSVNSLNTLTDGPDTFDLQSAQAAVAEAQRTYSNYFIRAPYDGIIGRIPVNAYGQAGGSTIIATIVGAQKIASISLNEVDAAKVMVGQPVNITFDAIDGLNATGTVAEVDQIGTVSQGVVSYGVKISINTEDPRIKPGMSVNTTIITKQVDGVLLVPSSAIKTQGNRSYVQVIDRSALASLLPAGTGSQSASSTRRFGTRSGTATSTDSANFASSTFAGRTGTSTRAYGNFGGGQTTGARTMTVPSSVPPQEVTVTIGDSDDTNTVILSGLQPGQLVVSRTITSGSTQTSAPSILSGLGGNRAGGAAGGGGNRTFTTGTRIGG